MKNNQVVKVLGAINESGKLASDMYELDEKFYLDSKDEHIPIGQMDYQHTIRAFVKLCREQDSNEGKVLDINMAESDLYKTIDAQEKIIAGLRSQVETLSDKVKDQDRGRVLRIKELNEMIKTSELKIKKLEGIIEEKDQDAMNTNKSWVDYAETLSENIGSLKEQLEEKDQEYMDYTAKIERLRDMYRNMASEVHRTNGCAYVFCEVPQDEEGKEFIKNCKRYLNRESYTIRVKGQHLKKDLYGQGRASWGANMEDSSHMRVYIDKKKGDK